MIRICELGNGKAPTIKWKSQPLAPEPEEEPEFNIADIKFLGGGQDDEFESAAEAEAIDRDIVREPLEGASSDLSAHERAAIFEYRQLRQSIMTSPPMEAALTLQQANPGEIVRARRGLCTSQRPCGTTLGKTTNASRRNS